MDEITDVDDRVQLAYFFRGIDMEFSVAKDLTALITLKGNAARADLYEVANIIMQCLNAPIRILDGAVTDEAPSIPGRKSGVIYRAT